LDIKKFYGINKEDIDLTDHFRASELDCNCCNTLVIDLDLIKSLEAYRNVVKTPIYITSGYRCQKHNARVGGVSNSFHTKGLAVDFNLGRKNMIFAMFPILFNYFNRIGIYAEAWDSGNNYIKGFFHVDTGSTPSPRYWICDRINDHGKYRTFTSVNNLYIAAKNSKTDWSKVMV
jgi:hypothetical protein